MNTYRDANQILDSIIIGAGQSGLAAAYYLKQLNRNFVVIDSNSEIGESWLKRWSSLKLFTPSQYNNLPGYDFPSPKGHYPNKYEVAEYLKMYAKKLELTVLFNRTASAIKKEKDVFEIFCQDEIFYAQEVIVASGPFHIPFVPGFSKNVSNDVIQIHSKQYLNPDQLKEGNVCVVGSGDSGVQITKEIAETNRKVYLSCAENTFTIFPQEFLGKTLWWWLKISGLLSIRTGSFLGKYIQNRQQPIIGTDVKALLNKSNVFKVGLTTNYKDNKLHFQDTSAEVSNIVWATGYKPDFGMLKFPNILNVNGYPKNKRGVSEIYGLYFIGLPWMQTRGSATLGGVKKDAKYLFEYLKKQNLKPIKSTVSVDKKKEEVLEVVN
ncbi:MULTISPECIES: flavin-containing monooxygenase [Aquimarina]|uniref:flavin-containing monooxygenase n=1 Tax=Aquimarina TaxID=290174 RepID=UPI000AF0AFEB|nr:MULTISPECIES: NAD(P)/FAD-dependent oxidoreductase [Aquimarina]